MKTILTILLASLLAACGGGDDEDECPSPSKQYSAAESRTASAEVVCAKPYN